jgi:hypothetical protein
VSARAYPVPAPRDREDPRFTVGLLMDVAGVLERHGYPPVTGDDLVWLQTALFRWLYHWVAVPL